MEEESLLPEDVLDALDEIDQDLHQMLILAELSAGEGNLDRASLQRVFEHLQDKIDRAADRLNWGTEEDAACPDA